MTTHDEQVPTFLSPKSSSVRRMARLVERAINKVERQASTARSAGASDSPLDYLVEERSELRRLPSDAKQRENLIVIDAAISYYCHDASFSRPSAGIGLGLEAGIQQHE